MTYPGGKNSAGVWRTIINQMPPHDIYIEPFCGSGAVVTRRRQARRNIACDMDDRCARFLVDVEALEFRHGCGIEFLRDYRYRYRGRVLVYCDPPFLWAVRSSQRKIYDHEIGDMDHVWLLDVLHDIPAMVMISGYPSDMYAERLREWRCIEYWLQTRGGTPRTECLWMNFDPPKALHDLRFLGDNFRERERIKRKVTRCRNNLDAMLPLERQAVLSALQE